METSSGFIRKSVLLAIVAVAMIFGSCEDTDKNNNENNNNNNNGNNNGTGSHDIDSALYGTWNDNRGANILTVTFSSSGVTWDGTSGSALNIQGAVWTAKNGSISTTYQGSTTTVWNYTINGSGELVLTSPTTNTTHTLVKEGESGPGGTWTPDDFTPIQLTENQWTDGNISTSGGQQWFMFTATASTQYIQVSFGTLTDLYVQFYDSTGSTVGYSESLYSSTYANFTFRSLTSGQKYYLKVTSYSGNGTYQIVFNTPSSFPSTIDPIEMIYVPGGSFQMGSNNSLDYDASPPHTVTLTGFYMGKYEVTQAQWQAVMGTTIQQLQTAALGGSTYYGRGDNYPVYYVSWYDALVFCNKLSIVEGLTPAYRISGSTDPSSWGRSNPTWDAVEVVSGSTGYRLPTEAQWEYAARGGNGSPGDYTYSGSNAVDDVAWYEDNIPSQTPGNSGYGTQPVGTKQPNGLGIYDMSGNVGEWCWDWYGNYPSTEQTNPVGASSGSRRVLRGGSWGSTAQDVRSAHRSSVTPFIPGSDGLGFRLLCP
jgi:formylglycine-generating enzyme required for sulfatase activity